MSVDCIKSLVLVSRFYGIKYLTLWKAKIGPRYMWAENEFYQNKTFIKQLKENVARYTASEEYSSGEYTQDPASKLELLKHPYSIESAIKIILRQLVSDVYREIYRTYKSIQGDHNKDFAYRMWGWVPVAIRRPLRYRYFLKYGKKIGKLDGFKIAFFALHQEPELTLQSHSPEFNNSLEIIGWISKSLPADALLVVREHPLSFGIRSRDFHECLRKMGNVVLAHPAVSVFEWIKRSKLVVTITGTTGYEAVYFGKPVVTYGKHQMIRHLPTVRYVSNYDTTAKSVAYMLSLDEDDILFRISKEALYKTQVDNSFDMVGREKVGKSKELQMGYAEIAVEQLKKQYKI